MLDNSYLSILTISGSTGVDASGNTILDTTIESDMIRCNVKYDSRKKYFDINNQMFSITEISCYCDLKRLLKLHPVLDEINQIYIYDINKSNKKKYLVYRYDVQTLTNSIKMLIEEKK